jgi:hypothetical protein
MYCNLKVTISSSNRKRMLVRTQEDIDHYVGLVRKAAEDARAWIAKQTGDSLAMLRQMKFETVGYHPIDGRPLNLVEQINQTWTYFAALAAAKQLLALHPEGGGFRLAPGAYASEELDIMSGVDGLVGAETFAAVAPQNNNKLAKDLAKLAARTEQHRYVFFMSPKYSGAKRWPELESSGIQV